MNIELQQKAQEGGSTSSLKWVLVLGAALLAGLAVRVWLCEVSTRHGYVWDQFDNIGMGLTAAKNGLLHVYSVQRKDLATVHGQIWEDGKFAGLDREAKILPNYPPICISLFYLQVKLLQTMQNPILANTFLARLVIATAPILADLVCAVVVMLLVRRFRSTGEGWTAAIVFWLFPPVVLNSTFWGQVDSFFLAPAAVTVLLMLRRRWLGAGIAAGITAMLKPQGILLGPIVLLGAVFLEENGDRASFAITLRRLGKTVGAGLAVVLAVTLPWTIADGLAWFNRIFVQSFVEAFPWTTLKAFNFWYFDALRLDQRMVSNALDSQVLVGEWTKDQWGRLLLVLSLAVAALICILRYRQRREVGVVVFAGLWLWSIFMWPTRVHERFMIYAVPFMVIAAWVLPRLWPALVALAILGAAEHTCVYWMQGPIAGQYDQRIAQVYYHKMVELYNQQVAQLPPERRPAPPTPFDALEFYRQQYFKAREEVAPWEYGLTFLSLAGYLWAMIAAGWRTPAVTLSGAAASPPGRSGKLRNRRRG